MSSFEDGMNLLDQLCGNGKDNVIALSTIALSPAAHGGPQPRVRDVDALYLDGAFYITTYALSGKMNELAANPACAFAVPFQGITGEGRGESLGWVMKPENAALREKLRQAFAKWYDGANNEGDENCVILAVRIATAHIRREDGGVRYSLDLTRRAVID